MNRAAVIIAVLVAALVGASIAIVCGMFVEPHLRAGMHGGWLRHDGGYGGAPGPHPPLAQVMPRLEHALDLTPAQVERLKPKVIATQKEFEAVRESLHSRIDVELTPAQRTRWHELERQRDLERQRGMRRPFPGDSDSEHTARPGAGEPGATR